VNDTRFVRNGFLALQERDGSNNIVREYLWGLHVGGGIGGLLTLKQGGQYYSYLYDGKGNITTLLDTAQNVEISYVYDTFGALISQTGPVDQPFRFSTKLYDEETGLSYFGYRFYSSLLGRWMTRDPLGEWGRFYDENEIVNLYDYVLGDPINKLDAFGLQVTFGDNEGVVCYPCGSCYHLWDKAPEEELLREIKKLGDEWFEELGKIEKCKGRWCKDGKLIRDESGKSIPKYETPNPYESPFYDWWMALFEVIVKKLKGDND
jgi:RHS repeat-associated protein